MPGACGVREFDENTLWIYRFRKKKPEENPPPAFFQRVKLSNCNGAVDDALFDGIQTGFEFV